MWCLGLDYISREVHPTAQVEVTAGTVRNFVNDYLAENGRRIEIIGQLSVNNSVQFWGVPNQSVGIGLPFICNLLYRVEAIGWGSGNCSNQVWGSRFNDAYSMTNVAWVDSINPLLSYLLQSHVNPHAARHRFHNDFLCRRRQERLWHQYNWHNLLVNPRVHRRG